MAMAARMPMIATTIISSIRVKPRWFPRVRWRLDQKRSIRSSVNIRRSISNCCQGLRLSGEASLHGGRENERRGARLRESDGNERSCAGFDRNEGGETGIADWRRDGLRRVVDKDEPIDDLVAVGFIVVLDPYVGGRIEVEIGQASLGRREKHQSAQQDREMDPLPATAT